MKNHRIFTYILSSWVRAGWIRSSHACIVFISEASSSSNSALWKASGPCLTVSNHEIQENWPCDESIHQSCSATMIITNMALALDLSLVPKVCYSCPLSKSDSRILSMSHLKTLLAMFMLVQDATQNPTPPLLLYERTAPLDPNYNALHTHTAVV